VRERKPRLRRGEVAMNIVDLDRRKEMKRTI
jgi:hypothetical protein